MKLFGLIGYPLTHSFSKKYFSEKFAQERIPDAAYELFPLPEIGGLPRLLIENPDLRGLNVTIPHKQAVIPYLDRLDSSAARIGAVNVVKIAPGGEKTGFNSDYYGFRETLRDWFIQLHGPAGEEKLRGTQALILGTGGASKAVKTALDDLGVRSRFVSRQASDEVLSYTQLDDKLMAAHPLIINTTPLGTYPDTAACPPIPYVHLTASHYLYDLVYNPTQTTFLTHGKNAGAPVMNGLPMLHAQAEKSWEIWNA